MSVIPEFTCTCSLTPGIHLVKKEEEVLVPSESKYPNPQERGHKGHLPKVQITDGRVFPLVGEDAEK